MTDLVNRTVEIGQTWEEVFGTTAPKQSLAFEPSKEKGAFQEWLLTKRFHFHVTTQVEGYSVDDEEIGQRLRKVDYDINRQFLSSHFSGFRPDDRFLGFCFFEGSNKSKDRHCHSFWQVPFHKIKQAKNGIDEKNRDFWLSQIEQKIAMSWNMLNSLDPVTGQVRWMKPLHIQRMHSHADSNSVTIYDSKLLDPLNRADDYFISYM